MSERTRWRITGTFTTTAPMHVGSGAVSEDPRLKNTKNEQNEEYCDVQAVTTDYAGKPCVPGTALKGVLRAWAEQIFNGDPAIDRVFGKRDSGQAAAEAGRAEFHTARVVPPPPAQCETFKEHVPYWPNEPRGERSAFTGIASSVSINRVTGAAERNKLFFVEFVPEGVTFTVEVTLARATAADVSFLLAVLEHGAKHATHPYQFGASGADGWGRVTWTSSAVTAWDGASNLAAPNVGFAACTATPPLPPEPTPTASPACRQFTLTLAFAGPFLVNDTSRTHRVEDDKLPHFTPLKRADGRVWLPASSFRGVLRSRAEFLAASCGWPATQVEDVFGTTSQASRLTVAEFEEVGRCQLRHQDFVAIDRFTGGAAEGAKFHANYANRPTVRTTLVLDTKDLTPAAERLLALAVRDVCRGEVTFGFGGSKGYGVATGTLCEAGADWLDRQATASPTPAASEEVAPAPVSPSESLTADTLTVEPSNPGFFNYYLKSQQGGKKPVRADYKQISQDLIGRAGTDIPVEFAEEGGKPVRIRHRGQPYIPAPSQPKATAPAVSPAARLSPTHFAHPYYFLRMDDREKFIGDLADANPPTHARYEETLYSGTIRVRLTTKTPLLLCDTSPGAATEGPPGHFTYRVLRDADGKPLLAASSVRGMLRSAYEAITNSRFGVFHGHEDRLGLRMATDEGLGLVPCRVAGGQIHLMPGTSRVTGTRPGGPMYAAWLAGGMKFTRSTGEPAHRQAVGCWLELWQRTAWDRRNNRFRDDQRFEYWKVVAIAPHGEPLASPPPTPPRPAVPNANHHTPLGEPLRFVADGSVCMTGFNFDRKHDERVFFTDSPTPPTPIPLTDDHRAAWANLIRDYRTNQDLVNGKPRPGALREAGWSRHMTDDTELTLSDGSLAYARLDAAGRVQELFPVMISRKLYEKSPRQLVPASLLPATACKELSPADRVFGWVSQVKATAEAGEPAHKSLVRVGPVTCEGVDAIQTHNAPVTLAILGQPKPAQGRFYVGDAKGFAQRAGGTKEERGYQGDVAKKTGNRVRGPKVYPHHRHGLVGDHYKTPPGPKAKSNQNRSVAEWVREGTAFAFDVHVTNLSAVELGALYWLLSSDSGRFLRLGLGKPLGFGSVRAEVAGACVNTGAEWVKAVPTGRPPAVDLTAVKAKFVEAITAANADLLKAFGIAAEGFTDLPVHYPPAQPEQRAAPGEEGGKHFQWFAANEGSGRNIGQRLSLPELTTDPALPNAPG